MDWIDQFVAYTEGLPTPEIFRQWCGIAAISGALERRVWAMTARKPLFPNLYVLLVATPGVGKSVAIDVVKELWLATKELRLASDSLTKASLVDELAGAKVSRIVGDELVEYSTLLVGCGELGVFISAHDLEFLSSLNNMFDCPRYYRERRRTNNLNVEIIHPSIIMLAATQPAFLGSIIPEEGWGMGFMSRMFMIYAGESPTVSLFQPMFGEDGGASRFNQLVSQLTDVCDLHGCVKWTAEAMENLEQWHLAGGPPVPEHSKLQYYKTRRTLYAIKLAMISAVSRTGQLTIHVDDVERARAWMIDAEQRMPDVFRQMVGKSDLQVLQELHLFAWQHQLRTKRPIPESVLVHFLTSHAPSDKITKLLDTADRSGMIVRTAGTNLWVAKSKDTHGVE